MNALLSQEEIDALLSGIGEVTEVTKEAEAKPTPTIGEVVPFDFEKATLMIKTKFPGLDIVNDQFNRGLRTTLSSILKLAADSSVAPIEIINFKNFLNRIPVPSNIHIIKLEPFRGTAMVVLDPKLVFSIVEIFLGSTKLGQSRIEGREFTSIEQRLIKRIIISILNDLERAWRNIHPVTIQYIRSEINPQFAKIAQNDDAVIISRFQIDLEEISGSITVCIPLGVLQPIKSKLQSTFQSEEAEDPLWRKQLIRNLFEVEVDITVPLGDTNITGAELMDLGVGDIIQLDTNIEDLLNVIVQDRPKFAGHPGLFRGQRAVRIEKAIKIDE
ncbi:flagellar motor switch protein FliM [Dissulfurimicrobium hydrothermale]|uniref:flagellar motor switch protein FliM n=1 Tax=Dissulfurimicrobium hydrothermale TaxID=1750598 RepID=UPI001EDB2690|nr:flagellar motor switch protein FliM [Dissulfurimicrobium hydrothermale]UKL13472.1 flagellar motor switch protein FliM [Dissulfurimicrobium hydrothermale]